VIVIVIESSRTQQRHRVVRAHAHGRLSVLKLESLQMDAARDVREAGLG